jgi:DNA (cytosine-5)-methyltransferase 1
VPRAPLRAPVRLCGSSFGLRVRRHRCFETNFAVMGVPCSHEGHEFVTVAGGGPNPASFRRGPGATGGPDRKPRNVADALDAMGVDWSMTRHEVNEAIPPAYTEHVGRYALAAVRAELVA